MIYKINEKYLLLECEIEEYKKNIQEKLSMFEQVTAFNINKDNINQIIIKKKFTKIIINTETYVVSGYLEKTDVYPIIYYCISKIINNKENLLIHSTLISKNNEGILFLGNFGQGKTMLANFLQSNGYDINSADQTWIAILGNKLISKRGSRQLIYENNSKLLHIDKITSTINIKEIVLLYGLCESGKYFEKKIEVESHFIKNIFQYSSWHSSIPLITNNEFLKNSNMDTLHFLKKAWSKKIPLKVIKGSLENILLNLNI